MLFFPQQRKLMGSSAQIRFGVRRCGSQAQVPEGSRGFCKVPVCAGAGSGGRFWRQVPDIFGRCRRVSEGAGGFQKVPECWQAQRFRKVWGGLEGSGEQNNAPICRFAIEKVNAHDTAMYALLLLGIPPKLIFLGC